MAHELCESTPRLALQEARDISNGFENGNVSIHRVASNSRSSSMRKIWAQTCAPYRGMTPALTDLYRVFTTP